MGRLYWVQSRNGEENLPLGCEVYKKILAKKENVIFLSSKETRKTKRDTFDTETTEKAWEQSANRDMRVIRYLTEQGIDVVYCSSCEFQETMDWVGKNIKEVELVSGEEENLSRNVILPHRPAGTMYWVTGLSGAGKTTVGMALYRMMQEHKKNIVLIDGDMFREALESAPDYSRKAREELSYRNIRFGKMLIEHGIDIVWCTITMFEGVREWNRSHIQNYVEIYLKVPMEVLEQRRTNLYIGAKEGTVSNVVGVNQEAEYPCHPDIIIHNDGNIPAEEIAESIWKKVHVWRRVTQESELDGIMDCLREQIEFSLYTYMDLMKYGLHDEDMKLYSIDDDEGKSALLALKYHNGMNLMRTANVFPVEKAVHLVEHLHPSIISGRRDIVETLQNQLKGQYVSETGHVLKWVNGTGTSGDEEVEHAEIGDCREIAELILGEESIGGYYEIEDMTRQLTQRLQEGMGRNYFLRRDGKIVAHCATYGECEEFAVVAGIVTDPAYRKQGLFRSVFRSMLHDLSEEGKDIYLFTYGEPLQKMYERFGMKAVGEWGKLVKSAT